MTDEATKSQVQWVKSPKGIFEVYANLAHITWSFDDVRVRLAQMVDSPETPSPGGDFVGVAEERAAVTFSWRNAKILRDNLDQAIDLYEKVNGEINVNVAL